MFSYFERIPYVMKRGDIKRQMKDNTYKLVVVVYANNHTIYTYKLYNPEIKRVIMIRDIKWMECKKTDPS